MPLLAALAALLLAILPLFPALLAALAEALAHLLALLRRHPFPAAHVVEQLPPLGGGALHHPAQLPGQRGTRLGGEAGGGPPAVGGLDPPPPGQLAGERGESPR